MLIEISNHCLMFLQGFNGADLRNVCTEAGMSAIRAERDYVIHEDFMKVHLFMNYSSFAKRLHHSLVLIF